MRYTQVLLFALLPASAASAQQAESYRPELRSFVGAYVPFGVMRDVFRDAPTVGVQGAFEVSARLHFVGTVGWTYGRHKVATLRRDDAHLIHYDVGMEVNALHDLSRAWRIKPFGGLGVGARTYDYGTVGVPANVCLAGYGALGSELQRRDIALRAETRQYITCFDPPLGGSRTTRSDAIYAVGIAYHLR